MVAAARWAYPCPLRSRRTGAPLLCAGIIGYRSLLLADRSGGRLGPVRLRGVGAPGNQVALHWKCEVFAFTREAHHRELARSLGAIWAGETFEDPGVELDSGR
jgi:propanol-preferring alcohol dehydrogenase